MWGDARKNRSATGDPCLLDGYVRLVVAAAGEDVVEPFTDTVGDAAYEFCRRYGFVLVAVAFDYLVVFEVGKDAFDLVWVQTRDFRDLIGCSAAFLTEADVDSDACTCVEYLGKESVNVVVDRFEDLFCAFFYPLALLFDAFLDTLGLYVLCFYGGLCFCLCFFIGHVPTETSQGYISF